MGSPGASTERREQSSRPLRGQPTLPTPALGAARKPWRARGTQAWLRPSVGTSCRSLLLRDLVSRVQRLRPPSPSPVSPSLPHYLSLSPSCLSRRSRRRCLSPGGPETPRAPPRATAPSGLPPHWLRPGAGVTAPRPAPRSPASWHCGPRRLRPGRGRVWPRWSRGLASSRNAPRPGRAVLQVTPGSGPPCV